MIFFAVSATAHLIYHSRLRLSSTFFNFFNSLFLMISNCFYYCYNSHYCFWIVFVVSVLFSATLTIIPPFKGFVNYFFMFFCIFLHYHCCLQIHNVVGPRRMWFTRQNVVVGLSKPSMIIISITGAHKKSDADKHFADVPLLTYRVETPHTTVFPANTSR